MEVKSLLETIFPIIVYRVLDKYKLSYRTVYRRILEEFSEESFL